MSIFLLLFLFPSSLQYSLLFKCFIIVFYVPPVLRPVHLIRSKTAGDAEDSKFLALDTQASLDPNCVPKGEMKGVVKRLRVSGPNLLITMESGEFLELKVNKQIYIYFPLKW